MRPYRCAGPGSLGRLSGACPIGEGRELVVSAASLEL